MKDKLQVGDEWFELMISPEEIAARVTEIAREVNRMMRGQDPICLIALKGGFVFASDLLRTLDFDPEVEFIGLRSYV